MFTDSPTRIQTYEIRGWVSFIHCRIFRSFQMVPDSEYVLNKYLLNTLINQLIFHKHITYQTNCAWFGCTVTEERSYVSAVVTWW